MDKHAKLLMAIGWFFIAYWVWTLLENIAIPSLLARYADAHHISLTNYAWWSGVPLFYRIIDIPWMVGLNGSLVAIALMLRAELRLRMVKAHSGQPDAGSGL